MDIDTKIVCCKEKGEVMFSFNGIIDEKNIHSILLDIEKKCLSFNIRLKKRIYNIALETLQNVYHHGQVTEMNEKNGKWLSFTIVKKNEGLSILIGNFVNNLTKEEIHQRLTRINQFSLVDLRQQYLKQLLNGDLSDKSTPGLGLLDIAKKSSKNIDCKVTKYDNNTYYLCVNVSVN